MTSIIIITYNRCKYLSRAIDSIFNQTIQDWELIVVDDGSEDDTADMIRDIKDSRVRYIRVPHSGHLSKLRNIGISNALGEYIAFLDSDDEWLPQKLEKQLDALSLYPDAAFSFTDIKVRDIHKEIHNGSFPYDQELIYGFFGKQFLMDKLVLFPSSFIAKKSCLEAINLFDETLEAGDHDLMVRLLMAYPGVLVNDPVVMINRHIANHSDQFKLRPVDDFIYTLDNLLSNDQISQIFYNRCKSRILYKKALYLNRLGHKKDARSAFFDSFITNPAQWKGLVKYFIS